MPDRAYAIDFLLAQRKRISKQIERLEKGDNPAFRPASGNAPVETIRQLRQTLAELDAMIRNPSA